MTRLLIDRLIALLGSTSLKLEWSKSGYMDFVWDGFDLVIIFGLVILLIISVRGFLRTFR